MHLATANELSGVWDVLEWLETSLCMLCVDDFEVQGLTLKPSKAIFSQSSGTLGQRGCLSQHFAPQAGARTQELSQLVL